MTYTITDIIDIIEYHLVASAPTNETADVNIAELMARLEDSQGRRFLQTAEWVFCDRCGCAVDTTVFAEDGSNFTPDGSFLCSSCLYPDDGDG